MKVETNEAAAANPEATAKVDEGAAKSTNQGDLKVALKSERERRKKLEQELSRRSQSKSSEGSKPVEVPDLDISDDDIFGDSGGTKLKQKIKEFGANLVKTTREAVLAEVKNNQLLQEEKSAVGKLLDQFEIFSDADESLRSDAQLAAIRALESAPEDADAEKVVEAVAKRFSQYKAEMGKASDVKADQVDPLPAGTSGGAAAHLRTDPKPATNYHEARSRSIAEVLKFSRKKN